MALILIACTLLGFAVRLFSFKVKSRWCPTCGVTLTCPECRQVTRERVRS